MTCQIHLLSYPRLRRLYRQIDQLEPALAFSNDLLDRLVLVLEDRDHPARRHILLLKVM
jgi:hypothetical protein